MLTMYRFDERDTWEAVVRLLGYRLEQYGPDNYAFDTHSKVVGQWRDAASVAREGGKSWLHIPADIQK